MLKWRKQRQTLTEIVLPFCNYQKQTEKIMSSCYSHEKMDYSYCKIALAKKSIAYNNKKNLNIYFSPSNQQKKILSLFQDVSNNQSLKVNSIEKQEQFSQSLLIQSSYSCAEAEIEDFSSKVIVNKSISNKNDFYEPSNSNFYSPTVKEPKLVVSCMVNSEDSLSSSRIGDATLDKMIDAIIESARREEKSTKRFWTQSDSFEDFYEPSIHEMEVKTPPTIHLKRQKVVRRKNKSELSVRKKMTINRIGLTLSNGIVSPKTPVERYPQTRTFEELVKMDTPQELAFVVESVTSGQSKSSTKISSELGILPNKTQSIKRCLSFSPNRIDKACTIGKCDSVTSLTSTNKTSLTVKGSLDLAIFKNNGSLNVHVIRCCGLKRSNGSTDINAYVKVALIPSSLKEVNENFQRTAVHKNSSRPYFDHGFKFNISNEKNILKSLQIEVWHRDRELKRSEFLGCVSFSVQNILKSAINGCYKLQPQECLTNPISPIPLVTLTAHTLISPLSQQALSSLISVNTTKRTRNNKKNNNKNSNKKINSFIFRTDMATATDNRQKSVEEDVISIDSVSASDHVINVAVGQPIALSKKAIHQRDADENLFLRFLELDPPNEHATSTGGSAHYRRMSTFKPTMGRTPFTVTKKLTRTADKGFGFSIVWTHPPRVEKVEPGMSADRAGIYPGDYVIFVDKHNVVTMPEADVLNLIRSQGNTLTLEIFRRTSSPGVPLFNVARSAIINGAAKPRNTSAASNYTYEELSPAIKQSVGVGDPRSSTACSNASIETTKKRLHLPQVTFSKEVGEGVLSIAPIHGVDDHRRRLLLQLVSREQNYVNALHFGIQRFVQPLNERKDLISPNDHRTLFQNIDELVRISEDILEQLIQGDHEPQLNFASRVYLSKTTAICAAYKKYCSGIKRADCVLVNKSRQPGSEFVSFITEPQVPRKRPDLTMFIHRPLQHFREILKLMQLLASHCHVDSEEHRNFISVIKELQAAYRDITVGGGLMEPLGEGRPLLTLQDLESRMVFTRCKPFSLAVQGRQWIFGGDLSRVEGRSIKPYWTLLFSDIIIFAKVSRDRVLFITEEPLPIANVVDSCFNIRKKTTEFRITVDPNGRLAESPTGYCAPDLTRTPRKNSKRKTLVLRAPSLELKAVWQNLLQRQIFLVNAALGSTPLSSPLDSPDVLNTLVPLSDIGAATASMASMKISSMDSINLKNQQNHQTNPAQQLEQLIDEKCRILNKTGTPKGSALHLANWMKGQLDKQQEQARLSTTQSKEHLDKKDSHILDDHYQDDEKITYWTREQLEKRTKELKLSKEIESSNEKFSGVEEITISDTESDIISPSRSTTSDSQITVRSSPNANAIDKLSVCRYCHKNCKQKLSPSPPFSSYSLKVQHSQSSPNRCCQLSSSVLANAPDNAASTISDNILKTNINRSSSATMSNTSTNTIIGKCQYSNENNISSEFTESNQNLDKTAPSTPVSTTWILNGTCSESESNQGSRKTTTTAQSSVSPVTTVTTVTMSSCPKSSALNHRKRFNNFPCTCRCMPEDFSNITLSPDELKQETCKILDDVSQLKNRQNEPTLSDLKIVEENPHKNCKCICKNKDKVHRENDEKSEDELSLILIGLAQFNPAAKFINSDAFIPTISVVPPTPEPILSKTTTNIWDNTTSLATKLTIQNTPRQVVIENIPEDSPDESPQDEEPPYRSLNAKLRRFGTMSSLEKLTLEVHGIDEHSSDDGEEDYGEGEVTGDENDDIEVITRQVFNSNDNNQAYLRNWTARAGSYVAEKMSFFEESRAFIDKYLGRWNQEQHNDRTVDEEQIEECTSGATSGEEVWGTPTSGGDNEEMQIGSSEHTQSSPTKSNSSLNDDDDDTELMMDELLMAPPMTASTIRGLLPRRRLEPLFEEETESDEEKTQQENDVISKGETSANGNNLEFSIGKFLNDGLGHISTVSYNYQLKTTSIKSTEVKTKVETVPGLTSVSTLINTASNTKNRDNSNNLTVMTTSTTSNATTITNSSLTTTQAIMNSVRKAKFSPPPPPPRRLLLTQINSKAINTQNQQPQDLNKDNFGDVADIGSLVDVFNKEQPNNIINNNQKAVPSTRNCVEDIDLTEVKQSMISKKFTPLTTTIESSTTAYATNHNQIQPTTLAGCTTMASQFQSPPPKAAASGSGLSPRLEMRLALNHDILGDEDLMNYDPGPDLTTILGHDLSTFHRLTGRDLLNRLANRIQPKEAVISYSQQRNSKMDTPTLNRRRHQQNHLQRQLQPNQSTWNNSVFADRIGRSDMNVGSCKSSNNSSDESKLSDLEILARQEKMYCMSQLKSGLPVKQVTTMKKINSKVAMRRSTSSTAIDSNNSNRIEIKNGSKANRIINFLTRRNSENQLSEHNSKNSLTESIPTPVRRITSPRKDNDKPSLNRRFWKQLSKRRRAHSVSGIVAS